jgi:hypothetical protein
MRSGISIHHVSEVRGLEELPFDCRSHEVSSVEGSGEHTRHIHQVGTVWLTGGHSSPGKESTSC